MSTTGGRTFPEPMEGITGTDRDDDLLSLEDEAFPRRMIMAGMARCLREATMVGSPAPVVQRMSGRMRDPQPGDLVIETSTFYSRDEDTRLKAMGILVAHRVEWWEKDAEWDAQVEEERAAYEEFLRGPYSHPGDEPFDPSQCERSTDHAWYVQYGPGAGDICRWVNCEFMTIPFDSADYAVPVGTSNGNGVTFTRNDLLGALADSGFALRDPVSGKEHP